MPGRYTDAQRAGIMANRRARAAGLRAGYSYEDQGYTGAKESGMAAYNLAKMKAEFGRFANPTWRYQVVNGQLMKHARNENPERMAETGGGWVPAQDYEQRGYDKTRGVEAYGPPSADAWQQYAMMQGLQRGINSGQIKAGGDGKYYYASGQAFDAGGHRLNDDQYTNPGLGASLFGGAAPGSALQSTTPQTGSYDPWGALRAPTSTSSYSSTTPNKDMALGGGGLGLGSEGAGGLTGDAQVGQFDPDDPYGTKKKKATGSLADLGA